MCHLVQRGKLVTAAFQRFPLFFQSSHQLSETFDTRAMRTANPLRMFLTPKVFLCVHSFIRVLSRFQLASFLRSRSHGSRCSSSLFTDGPSERHKVTVFLFRHSMSCKCNETHRGMTDDKRLGFCLDSYFSF